MEYVVSISRWIPNKNYLRALHSMGIRKSDAVKALYHTNNSSADAAATWLFETLETEQSSQPMPPGVSVTLLKLIEYVTSSQEK